MTARNFSIPVGRPLGASLVLGTLLLAGVLSIAASWADLSSTIDERDAKADLLERGVAASRRAKSDPTTTTAVDPFVTAGTATLAAAKVDADLRSLALASGLALTSSRAEAKLDDTGPESGIGTRIEIQATVEGTNEALQTALLKLETGSPTVLVDSLAVEPAGGDSAPAGDPQAPRLRMSLVMSAYWRKGQT